MLLSNKKTLVSQLEVTPLEEHSMFRSADSKLELSTMFLTFFLLWTISILPIIKAEELTDVKVDVIKEGKNCDDPVNVAQAGDHLHVHYTGRFDDENGKIFDTSKERGQLYTFQLGAGQVMGNYCVVVESEKCIE